MASVIQVKRGLEQNRLFYTPLAGEFLYTTDEKLVYIGDGITPGGNLVKTQLIAGSNKVTINVSGSYYVLDVDESKLTFNNPIDVSALATETTLLSIRDNQELLNHIIPSSDITYGYNLSGSNFQLSDYDGASVGIPVATRAIITTTSTYALGNIPELYGKEILVAIYGDFLVDSSTYVWKTIVHGEGDFKISNNNLVKTGTGLDLFDYTNLDGLDVKIFPKQNLLDDIAVYINEGTNPELVSVNQKLEELKQGLTSTNFNVNILNPTDISTLATSANQLPDNHQVTVSNMIPAVETGLAKDTNILNLNKTIQNTSLSPTIINPMLELICEPDTGDEYQRYESINADEVVFYSGDLFTIGGSVLVWQGMDITSSERIWVTRNVDITGSDNWRITINNSLLIKGENVLDYSSFEGQRFQCSTFKTEVSDKEVSEQLRRLTILNDPSYSSADYIPYINNENFTISRETNNIIFTIKKSELSFEVSNKDILFGMVYARGWGQANTVNNGFKETIFKWEVIYKNDDTDNTRLWCQIGDFNSLNPYNLTHYNDPSFFANNGFMFIIGRPDRSYELKTVLDNIDNKLTKTIKKQIEESDDRHIFITYNGDLEDTITYSSVTIGKKIVEEYSYVDGTDKIEQIITTVSNL